MWLRDPMRVLYLTIVVGGSGIGGPLGWGGVVVRAVGNYKGSEEREMLE